MAGQEQRSHGTERGGAHLKTIANLCLWTINCVLAIWVINLYWSALLYVPVNIDAGYYLSVTEKIRSGSVLFKDVGNVYAPFAFYILAAARELTPKIWPDFTVYLGTVLIFLLGQGVLVWFILRHFKISKAMCSFASLWTLILLGAFEGFAIFLEPFSAFFGLAAVLLILKHKNPALLFSGIFASLSLFSKQYGILLFPGLFLYLFMDSKKFQDFFQKLWWFSIGCLIPAITFWIYYCIWNSIPALDLLKALSMSGYAKHPNVVTEFTDFNYLNQLMLLVFEAPILILCPLAAVWSPPSERKNILLFVFLCFFCGITLLIRPFNHYFGLFLSYVVILEVLTLWALTQKKKILLLFTSGFVLWGTLEAYRISENLLFDPTIREQQYAVAAEINKIWPPGARVLVYASPAFTYLAHFDPIDESRPSYLFTAAYSGSEQLELIIKSQRILIDRESLLFFTAEREKIKKEGKSLETVLNENHYDLITTIGTQLELWERKKI